MNPSIGPVSVRPIGGRPSAVWGYSDQEKCVLKKDEPEPMSETSVQVLQGARRLLRLTVSDRPPRYSSA
jgi:hypothetical protein